MKELKPEAFRYGIDPRPDWFDDKVTLNEIITYIGNNKDDVSCYHCLIKSKNGNQEAKYGDYIIRCVTGEIHAITSELFHLTYEIKS